MTKELIVVSPEAEGLPTMLADLIRRNIERDPTRARLIAQPGRVNISVPDAEVEVGLLFTGRSLSIGSPLPDPELSVTCDSDVLMSLTSVPLRFGLPDQLTKEGRQVAGWLVDRTIKVKGLARHPKLMVRLQKLFNVN